MWHEFSMMRRPLLALLLAAGVALAGVAVPAQTAQARPCAPGYVPALSFAGGGGAAPTSLAPSTMSENGDICGGGVDGGSFDQR